VDATAFTHVRPQPIGPGKGYTICRKAFYRTLSLTREIIQDYASGIVRHQIAESWVSCLLARHNHELSSQFTTYTDSQRRIPDSDDDQRLKIELRTRTIWTKKAS
jgi:hypothetical protein